MTHLQKKQVDAELDIQDLRILRSLNEDARKSYRDIARELHLSRKTVSERIEAMEDAGVIEGYMPVIDATRVGFDIVAIINILFCTHERITIETANDLAKDRHVFLVFGSTGEWECVAMARFKTIRDLDAFVKMVAAHRNVDRVSVQMILNSVKDDKRIQI